MKFNLNKNKDSLNINFNYDRDWLRLIVVYFILFFVVISGHLLLFWYFNKTDELIYNVSQNIDSNLDVSIINQTDLSIKQRDLIFNQSN